jgi:NAD(P)H-nitrite reductase large subunit
MVWEWPGYVLPHFHGPARGLRGVGECARHRGEVYGRVAPLWEQAGVLADHITGKDPLAASHGSRTARKLKVAGVDVAAMGLKCPDRDEDEFVRFSEPQRGVYKTVIAKLVGATLLGDVTKVAFLTQAFDRGLPLPEERVRLLFDPGGSHAEVGAAELDGAAQVCNCNGVSKAQLYACVKAGEKTVIGVMAATSAASASATRPRSASRSRSAARPRVPARGRLLAHGPGAAGGLPRPRRARRRARRLNARPTTRRAAWLRRT